MSLTIESEPLGDNDLRGKTITSLTYSRHFLGETTVKLIAGITTLKALTINHSDMIADYCVVLSAIPSLTHLAFRRVNIYNEQVEKIATTSTVQNLEVYHAFIQDTSAIALARNTTITSLNLETNAISCHGAEALSFTTTIKELNISCNCIGEQGVVALANNTCIETLDISYTTLGETAAKALATNTALTRLVVSNCNLEGMLHIIAQNSTLLSLVLNNYTPVEELPPYYKPVSSDGAIALAANTTLTSLEATITRWPSYPRSAFWTTLEKNERMLYFYHDDPTPSNAALIQLMSNRIKKDVFHQILYVFAHLYA